MTSLDFDTIDSNDFTSHWSSYHTGDSSAILPNSAASEARQGFRDRLGEYMCRCASDPKVAESQIRLSEQIMAATETLWKSKSHILLSMDAIEEIICLRYVSRSWSPIEVVESEEPTKSISTKKLQNYANRRRFLLKFFLELYSIFEQTVKSKKLLSEESIWLRDYWQNIINCLVVEVFLPDRIASENKLFRFRPTSYVGNVFRFRFIRNTDQSDSVVEERAPWIDRLILNLLSKTLQYVPFAQNELEAALRLEGELMTETRFRFYCDANDRTIKINGPQQEIDIRYFGKSFERLLDRPLMLATQYLIETSSTDEQVIARDKIHALNRLLTSYNSAASKLSSHFLETELYFPPVTLPDLPFRLFAPAASMMAVPLKINPARDVAQVYETLEGIS